MVGFQIKTFFSFYLFAIEMAILESFSEDIVKEL